MSATIRSPLNIQMSPIRSYRAICVSDAGLVTPRPSSRFGSLSEQLKRNGLADVRFAPNSRE